jgi:hypothetical protein
MPHPTPQAHAIRPRPYLKAHVYSQVTGPKATPVVTFLSSYFRPRYQAQGQDLKKSYFLDEGPSREMFVVRPTEEARTQMSEIEPDGMSGGAAGGLPKRR